MRAICAIVLMLLATSAYAQELTVICKYERSVDDGEDQRDLGGDVGQRPIHLPIGTPNNLKIKTTKTPCYEFVGDGDDMRIRGVCLRYLGERNGAENEDADRAKNLLGKRRVRGNRAVQRQGRPNSLGPLYPSH